jgi:hypothetical protein
MNCYVSKVGESDDAGGVRPELVEVSDCGRLRAARLLDGLEIHREAGRTQKAIPGI